MHLYYAPMLFSAQVAYTDLELKIMRSERADSEFVGSAHWFAVGRLSSESDGMLQC